MARGWRLVLVLALGALAAGIMAGRPPPRMPSGPPGGSRITRCPVHGIAYDEELEQCPACAAGAPG